jgi:hypothetical protein
MREWFCWLSEVTHFGSKANTLKFIISLIIFHNLKTYYCNVIKNKETHKMKV